MDKYSLSLSDINTQCSHCCQQQLTLASKTASCTQLKQVSDVLHVVKINQLYKLIFIKSVSTQPFNLSGSQKDILIMSTYQGCQEAVDMASVARDQWLPHDGQSWFWPVSSKRYTSEYTAQPMSQACGTFWKTYLSMIRNHQKERVRERERVANSRGNSKTRQEGQKEVLRCQSRDSTANHGKDNIRTDIHSRPWRTPYYNRWIFHGTAENFLKKL